MQPVHITNANLEGGNCPAGGRGPPQAAPLMTDCHV
jgi:hypothetical protein